MKKKEILQNKINDKTLTLYEREDRFLDLQILELNEKESYEKLYIKAMLEKIKYVFENLNNQDFNFKFYEEEINIFGNYDFVISVNTQELNFNIINIYYYDNFEYVELISKEKIDILIEYQRKKEFKNNDEDEQEF